MARPSAYNASIPEQVKEMALAGKTDEEIALQLSVSRSTLAMWKVRHPEFADALKAWKDQADDAVEHSLYHKALSGDTTACIFWLKNRRAQQWRDVRHIDGKQEVTHKYDLDSLTDERLDALESILADAATSEGGESETISPIVH